MDGQELEREQFVWVLAGLCRLFRVTFDKATGGLDDEVFAFSPKSGRGGQRMRLVEEGRE